MILQTQLLCWIFIKLFEKFVTYLSLQFVISINKKHKYMYVFFLKWKYFSFPQKRNALQNKLTIVHRKPEWNGLKNSTLGQM